MVIYIKKYVFFSLIILFIILGRIIYLSVYKKSYYTNLLKKKTQVYTYDLSAPRGKILDINGNVIVDNIKKRVITYEKNSNITKNMEFTISKKLSKYLNGPININNNMLSIYIFDKNPNIKKYLSNTEYDKLSKSIISYKDAKNIALKNIENKYLDTLQESDKKEAYIYYLMNKDYKYDKKIIFKNISDEMYFKIMSENIPGVSGEYIYERSYPYGYKSIYGSIGKIDETDLKDYLNKGYSLSDIVGKSYLEKEYEHILKGKKGVYKVNNDGTLTKVKNEEKGEDLVLNIDINIDNAATEIMKKHILNTKGKTNAEYYNGSYLIIGKPTGEIVSMVGLKLGDDKKFYDVSRDVINSSFTVGSVVKAASNTVAYKENAIKIGKKINDGCVKLYNNTKKCSYKRLGLVDDITAIEKSSNYYQYINALKVMGYNKYTYNMKVVARKEDFDKYRNIFKEYGLGSKSQIDLPNESTGIKGNIISADLLLNLSIGQYDSYTPLMLLSYINTLSARGKRYNLSLLSNNQKIINEVDIESEKFNRILTGLNNVVLKGTGKGYIKNNDGAGKTGTSETLIDLNNDGLYETKTITTSFIGFMPFDNPKYTFIIISPNISSNKTKKGYKVPINRYIISDLTNILFEN